MTKKNETRLSKATPKIDTNCQIPDYEDFAVWCEHPVTIFVATALKNYSEQLKQDWLTASWEGGISDPLTLSKLSSFASAYAAFAESGKDDYVEFI